MPIGISKWGRIHADSLVYTSGSVGFKGASLILRIGFYSSQSYNSDSSSISALRSLYLYICSISK